MRASIAALSSLIGVACMTSAAGRQSSESTAARLALTGEIDSIFAEYNHPGTPGASVTVIRNGRVVASRSYGLADVETRTPITDRTNFRLASLTKQFTATAILLLVKDGKLRLDDRIADVLPGLPAHARGITIRQLLTHTSGIWAYEDFVPDSQTYQVKDRDVPALIGHADSTYFPPGSAFRYSNTGYALLALVVERLAGEPFARVLHDRIFVPLGMDSTVAYEAGVSTIPQRAFGYTAIPSTGGFRRTDQSNTSAVLGDGGIYSSATDLARWNRALDEHTLIDPATQRLAWTPATVSDGHVTNYGFGWWVDRDSFGVKLWHNGETRGFTNGIVKYPERGITVIVLTNRTGGRPWDLAAAVAHLPSLE